MEEAVPALEAVDTAQVPLAADMAAPVAVVVVLWAPVQTGDGSFRPVAGCNDYTWVHLPVVRFGRTLVAIPAIFAARMARSSLLIRLAFR